MFLTTLLRAKAKSKNVLVMCESLASGHRVNLLRERNADKMEFIRYDPWINEESLYKEVKKLKSVKIVLRHQKGPQGSQGAAGGRGIAGSQGAERNTSRPDSWKDGR